MEFKDSRTEKNLLTAFILESQDRSRHTIFSTIAEKDGYREIARLFLDTAENDRIHAKVFFRELKGGEIEITSKYSAGQIGSTEENLIQAIEGKLEKIEKVYPSFAQTARDENFEEIARLFLNVIVAEQFHLKRFKKLLKLVQEAVVWKRDEPVEWICSKCAFTINDKEPPVKCPACSHPREYFRVIAENL